MNSVQIAGLWFSCLYECLRFAKASQEKYTLDPAVRNQMEPVSPSHEKNDLQATETTATLDCCGSIHPATNSTDLLLVTPSTLGGQWNAAWSQFTSVRNLLAVGTGHIQKEDVLGV